MKKSALLTCIFSITFCAQAQAQVTEPHVFEVTSEVIPAGITRVNPIKEALFCGAEPASLTSEAPGLCAPDPFDALCENVPPTVKAHISRMNDAEARVTDWLKSTTKRSISEFKALNPRAYPGAELDSRREKFIETQIVNGLDSVQKANVEKAVKNVFESMKSVMEKRPLLRPESRAAILKMLEGCGKTFSALPAEVGETNASVNQITSHLDGSTYADEPLVSRASSAGPNPYETLAENYSCKIRLTPRLWAECNESSETCFLILSHELGHMFNSCQYIEASMKMEQSTEEKRGWLGDHFKIFGRLKFKEEQANLAKAGHEFQELGLDLLAASGCLEITSAPKMGIPSRCKFHSTVPNDVIKRCGIRTVEGYPSQWSEAEADLWGASSYAAYLNKIPSEHDRREKALAAISESCR